MLCELVEPLVHTRQLHIIDHIDAREVAEARLMLHLGDAVGHDVAHAAVLIACGRLAGCADLTHQVVTRHADLEPAVHQHAVRDGMAYEAAGVVCLGLRAYAPFLAVPQFPQRLLRGRLVAQRVAVAHLDGTLFTFVEMQQELGSEWPSTNNAVESVNSRIRDMLYLHRGLPLMHRIKAIFWWCYMHTKDPLPAAEILRVMPTDDKVDGLFAAASSRSGRDDGAPDEYGNGIVWDEFHMPTEYRQ